MILGKIIKKLVCSAKDYRLDSTKIYIVKLLNSDLTEKDSHIVAIENRLGLGKGDIVLLVRGSGARKAAGNTDMPIDCAVTAKVESVNIDPKYNKIKFK